ncbi:GntR family transcriptional regulator [Diaphorobacter caeni]|uniref:GntR family transcriptional regulator n=1 Tax=Diaphorobacter caeni TaxID=2784387 RepID=UPI00189059C3|nr:GntR family transcriptional regulator [Diaphorobacter caeni]MBF5005329.1 GntR family transcriptional regulator [Diaphorobacter caeni]
MTPASPLHIAERIVEAVLAQKLAPGDRLGEQELADNFAVSRTVVREAMVQLQARGFVQVQPRKGWFIVQPSAEEARDAFSARRIIESGIVQEAGRPMQSVIGNLRKHIAHEKNAIDKADAATRAFLLADFHVCLAEQMGHKLLADTLRDLTARTTLAATLYQSTHNASQSCAEHERIVQALEAGDTEAAKRLLIEHIGSVEQSLAFAPDTPPEAETASRLRNALTPVRRVG